MKPISVPLRNAIIRQENERPKEVGSLITDYLTGALLHREVAQAIFEQDEDKKLSLATHAVEQVKKVRAHLSRGLTALRSYEKAMRPKAQLPTVAAGWSGQVAFYKAESEKRLSFLAAAVAACRAAGLKPGDDAREALASVTAPDGGRILVRKHGQDSSVVNLTLNGAGVDVFRKITAKDVEENYANAAANVNLARELETFAREVEATSDDELRVVERYVEALRKLRDRLPEASREQCRNEIRRIESSFGVSK